MFSILGITLELANCALIPAGWEAGVFGGRFWTSSSRFPVAFAKLDDGGFAVAVGRRELLVAPR